MSHPLPDKKIIKRLVKYALREDIGSGDVTARLTPKKSDIDGKIITREHGVVCGTAWVDEVFRKVGKRHKTRIDINWKVKDGEQVEPNQELCRFEGVAHPILSGERTALNIMQTLSGTATVTRQYADAIAHTKARLLDTRKTLPMMREAQKYAVRIIIKENHLRSGKSLERIVADAIASMPAGTLVELEVESIEELERGLHAGAKRIMLDDFSLEDMQLAVELTGDQADLEASGGVNIESIAGIAETGVDFISSGSITKHVRALDLSMLFDYR